MRSCADWRCTNSRQVIIKPLTFRPGSSLSARASSKVVFPELGGPSSNVILQTPSPKFKKNQPCGKVHQSTWIKLPLTSFQTGFFWGFLIYVALLHILALVQQMGNVSIDCDGLWCLPCEMHIYCWSSRHRVLSSWACDRSKNELRLDISINIPTFLAWWCRSHCPKWWAPASLLEIDEPRQGCSVHT